MSYDLYDKSSVSDLMGALEEKSKAVAAAENDLRISKEKRAEVLSEIWIRLGRLENLKSEKQEALS